MTKKQLHEFFYALMIVSGTFTVVLFVLAVMATLT